ncbi:LVIVD repeat-containing protein [Aeromicrobium sp. Leaf291]|uniref:LVIVD repeat-containing protein n=1 Tax=Aeromicrobium sp. Leaf291 TaxID=1736325 RepID=UPI0006FB30F0|nr:hypothetical protein [Aeromicrobium sp. Leaf291]KQP82120.1 hypothetical protein ASF35_11775 [Aeromicrobium sp. Leaf291]
MRISRRRATTALLGAAATGALTAALLSPMAATAEVQARDTTSDECDGEVVLSEADRLAGNCLPGNDTARMNASGADLAPGEEANSKNVERIATIAKQGAFATEDALNSDLAFQGKYAFAGNYNGFMVYDISKPARPKVVTQVVCAGSQNDISVYDDVLILSTDSSRSDASCQSTAQSATIKDSWEGVKVFDISDPRKPKYVSAVETPCGSHTHTLAPGNGKPGKGKGGKPGKGSKNDLYVYVSSYAPDAAFPDCQPPLDSISIVKVPLKKPSAATMIAQPVLFPDGGNPAGGYSRETSGCHDLTAYPSKDIMAGACMGDGILLDIGDREKPKVTENVRDTENFAFWHSATFNNDGTKVVFTDELGGGGAPTCNPTVGDTKGANGIYDITRKGDLEFKSYYKIPRTQANTENCVAHNGSLVPVKGKDIMVQAWYQGGWSMFDFTDSANPKEIAWHDRGPNDAQRLVVGGPWSTYYYNGYVYSNEIQRGFDVFKVDDRRIKGAERMRFDELNPQSQPRYRE